MIRSSKTFILSLAAVVGIAGCTTDPSAPYNPNRQAQQGALIGAVGGAIAGRAAGGVFFLRRARCELDMFRLSVPERLRGTDPGRQGRPCTA